MIYQAVPPDSEDEQVLAEIHDLRRKLVLSLRTPRRWTGGLRRHMLARAIQGSNSIEGYNVTLDDAAAAMDDNEPLSADQETFAEIRGYRQALGYVLIAAGDPHFVLDTSAIRSMHYMMLSHDLSKSPGQYRQGDIYVHNSATGKNVYQGPDADAVAGLMDEFSALLSDHENIDPFVHASLAHLNLLMIHPFRDGNGRMARALQTLVLGRRGIGDPSFSSIEEWLGRNTDDYYRVLAATGEGVWKPEGDTTLWLKFILRAHHMQAQTVDRRLAEAHDLWTALDELVAQHHLPDRVTNELYDATLGFRIRRGPYVKRAEIEERTATRDLSRLVDLGIFQASGETKNRHYLADETLLNLRDQVRSQRPPLTDPYPWMRERLRDYAS